MGCEVSNLNKNVETRINTYKKEPDGLKDIAVMNKGDLKRRSKKESINNINNNDNPSHIDHNPASILNQNDSNEKVSLLSNQQGIRSNGTDGTHTHDGVFIPISTSQDNHQSHQQENEGNGELNQNINRLSETSSTHSLSSYSSLITSNSMRLLTPSSKSLNPKDSFNSTTGTANGGSSRQLKQKLKRASLVRSRLETMIVSSCENHALVFIKPHAAHSQKVRDFVEMFLHSHCCNITAEGELFAREIEQKGIIDKHYSAIATNAMKVLPKDLFVTEEKKKEFHEKFGESWDELNAKEGILNIKTLKEKYPDLTAQEIDDAWLHQSTTKLKLGPGNYVGRIVKLEKVKSPIYLINGFYSSMRDLYVAKGAKVIYYTVEWEESDLSWADFRSKVIGSTDPKEADPNSLRGRLYREYKAFGLSEEPDKGKNCVHASAGPVEAMKERVTWLEMDLTDDPFARAMKSKGVSEKLIKSWSENETCTIKGKQGPAFDLLEGLNSSAVIDLAIETDRQLGNKEKQG